VARDLLLLLASMALVLAAPHLLKDNNRGKPRCNEESMPAAVRKTTMVM
jgi:hypothetical protein